MKFSLLKTALILVDFGDFFNIFWDFSSVPVWLGLPSFFGIFILMRGKIGSSGPQFNRGNALSIFTYIPTLPNNNLIFWSTPTRGREGGEFCPFSYSLGAWCGVRGAAHGVCGAGGCTSHLKEDRKHQTYTRNYTILPWYFFYHLKSMFREKPQDRSLAVAP